MRAGSELQMVIVVHGKAAGQFALRLGGAQDAKRFFSYDRRLATFDGRSHKGLRNK